MNLKSRQLNLAHHLSNVMSYLAMHFILFLMPEAIRSNVLLLYVRDTQTQMLFLIVSKYRNFMFICTEGYASTSHSFMCKKFNVTPPKWLKQLQYLNT